MNISRFGIISNMMIEWSWDYQIFSETKTQVSVDSQRICVRYCCHQRMKDTYTRAFIYIAPPFLLKGCD